MRFLVLASIVFVRAERLGSPRLDIDASTSQKTSLAEQSHRNLQVQASYPGNNGKPTGSYPLKVCQGDCDNDSECEGSLKCFQRSGQESVPGCTGISSRWNGIDFCYDPGNKTFAPSPDPGNETFAPSPGPGNETFAPSPDPGNKTFAPSPSQGTIQKVGDDGSPSSVFPLQRCQGDCDADKDCAGTLVCYQRRSSDPVPGCSGSPEDGIDYCVNNADVPSNPSPSPPSGDAFRLRLYWEEGYYWQESYSEKKYCMQCDGSSCGDGDKVYIQRCGGDNTYFQHLSRSGDKSSFKDRKSDLCMSLENDVIRMRSCDSSDSKQRFRGSFDSSKFEIHPVSDGSDCLTQQHHPKSGEEVRRYSCSTARGDDTSYWNRY